MAINPAGAAGMGLQLYQGVPGATAATVYTAPGYSANVTSPAATAIVTGWVICNTSATASGSIALYAVASGGTIGTANAWLYNFLLAPNDTLVSTQLNQYLPASSTIAAAGTNVTLTLSGVEIQ